MENKNQINEKDILYNMLVRISNQKENIEIAENIIYDWYNGMRYNFNNKNRLISCYRI